MRLRYLHLPRCGPLTEASIVFGREDLVTEALKLPRKGSLNFVVGVNGSGKSSLLRSIYQVFRSLKNNKRPPIPLTLAWDNFVHRTTETAIIHIPSSKTEEAWFAVLSKHPGNLGKSGWDRLVTQLSDPKKSSELGLEDQTARGDAVFGSLLQAYLPKRLIAYSSGAVDPWAQLDHRSFEAKIEDEAQFEIEDERPPGWSMDLEWEELKSSNTGELLRRAPMDLSPTQMPPSGSFGLGEWQSRAMAEITQNLEQLRAVGEKVSNNYAPRNSRLEDVYFRIATSHLRYAGIILALWQAAKELAGRSPQHEREALRNLFAQKLGYDGLPPTDGRRVLNQIDWFAPSHLSITYYDADDRASPRQHQELLCLVALADEVIALPRGRMRAVLSLGPSDRINLTEKLKDAFPLGLTSKTFEFIAERVDGCKTGAEAILRIFSEDKAIDSTPMDVFTRLRDWEHTGLLEELSLTLQRNHRPNSSDGKPDDIVVTYDQLSDGEQMLIGRMGLLFLLRGQDGSLLLLDEPETHFNDVWKREIVEMVDLGLLNSTQANVVVATHTSIALTDAFAAEVTLLTKHEGRTSAAAVALPLFGADPGRVLLHVFGAPDMIGVRAAKLLRAKLAQVNWTDADKESLRALIDETGSGWPRAKLMEILDRLDTPDAAPSS